MRQHPDLETNPGIKRLYEMALDHPAIHHGLRHYAEGSIDWETALLVIALVQTEALSDIMDRYLQRLQLSPSPPIVPKA